MNNWEIFEDESCKFLNYYYSNKNVSFKKIGGSDSNLSDIAVTENNITKFFIESKMSGAQCGQFVLLNNNTEFIYSHRNKSINNEHSISIINYMNKNYANFKSVSSKSLVIDIDKDISYNWIIAHYLSKSVKYVITGYDVSNFIIFPLEKFDKYFDITANFRVKKSGSRNLSKKYVQEAQSIINGLYKSDNIYYEDSKAFIKIYDELPSKTTLDGGSYTYYLVHIDDDIYQIRMLSNTFNANVIFSCNLKQNQDTNDILSFKNDVK